MKTVQCKGIYFSTISSMDLINKGVFRLRCSHCRRDTGSSLLYMHIHIYTCNVYMCICTYTCIFYKKHYVQREKLK